MNQACVPQTKSHHCKEQPFAYNLHKHLLGGVAGGAALQDCFSCTSICSAERQEARPCRSAWGAFRSEGRPHLMVPQQAAYRGGRAPGLAVCPCAWQRAKHCEHAYLSPGRGWGHESTDENTWRELRGLGDVGINGMMCGPGVVLARPGECQRRGKRGAPEAGASGWVPSSVLAP